MNNPSSSDPTVAYYNRNASVFIRGTQGIDMSHLYAEFVPHVRKGGRILDAGCGSGRDARFFKEQGFVVSAFDASCELAAMASVFLGERVQVMTFLDLDAVAEYDGIWACASLLHVSADEMDRVFDRFARALKPGGALYVSFKYGSSEEQRDGRFFNDYNEAKLQALISRQRDFLIEKLWQSHDSRPGREHELWLNAILKKSS